MPRSSASSIMFRQRTKGSSISATCTARSSARSRFLASPTTTTACGRPSRTRSRVTFSSSDEGSSDATPGVSTTLTFPIRSVDQPATSSTVVPG